MFFIHCELLRSEIENTFKGFFFCRLFSHCRRDKFSDFNDVDL